MISGIIKVQVSIIRRPRLIIKLTLLTETLIIPDITKTESNCFIIHCFEINNDKYTVALNRLALPLEIMCCVRNPQISQLSATR